jgi:hypothetical protein
MFLLILASVFAKPVAGLRPNPCLQPTFAGLPIRQSGECTAIPKCNLRPGESATAHKRQKGFLSAFARGVCFRSRSEPPCFRDRRTGKAVGVSIAGGFAVSQALLARQPHLAADGPDREDGQRKRSRRCCNIAGHALHNFSVLKTPMMRMAVSSFTKLRPTCEADEGRPVMGFNRV